MKRDLKDVLANSTTEHIAPQAMVDTVVGTAVDLKSFRGASAKVLVGAWTDGTYTFALQESDDNSTFSAVAAGNLDGAFTVVSGTATDNVNQYVHYRGSSRYIRLSLTETSASTGLVVAGEIIPGFPVNHGQTLAD